MSDKKKQKKDGESVSSYYLRIGYDALYKAICGNLDIEVFDAGNYVRMHITNNSVETEELGGEYLIQREINVSFRTFPRYV